MVFPDENVSFLMSFNSQYDVLFSFDTEYNQTTVVKADPSFIWGKRLPDYKPERGMAKTHTHTATVTTHILRQMQDVERIKSPPVRDAIMRDHSDEEMSLKLYGCRKWPTYSHFSWSSEENKTQYFQYETSSVNQK